MHMSVYINNKLTGAPTRMDKPLDVNTYN